MTLRQQFSILTGLLVLILLSGSLLLTLSNARSAFEQQLNARAYDAATSLALSMSQTAGDTVQLQRQMDALFDRGFFALIELQVTDGSLLQRRADDVVSNVPDWLPRLFALDLLVAETDVTSGWQRLGTLRVLEPQRPGLSGFMDHGTPRTAMVRTGAGAQPAVIAMVIALAVAATGGSGKTGTGDLQPPMAGAAQHSQSAGIASDGAGRIRW